MHRLVNQQIANAVNAEWAKVFEEIELRERIAPFTRRAYYGPLRLPFSNVIEGIEIEADETIAAESALKERYGTSLLLAEYEIMPNLNSQRYEVGGKVTYTAICWFIPWPKGLNLNFLPSFGPIPTVHDSTRTSTTSELEHKLNL